MINVRFFFLQIGLVKFGSAAATPTGYNNDGRSCHSERLSDATPINIKFLKDYVDTLFARGKDDHKKSFWIFFFEVSCAELNWKPEFEVKPNLRVYGEKYVLNPIA